MEPNDVENTPNDHYEQPCPTTRRVELHLMPLRPYHRQNIQAGRTLDYLVYLHLTSTKNIGGLNSTALRARASMYKRQKMKAG